MRAYAIRNIEAARLSTHPDLAEAVRRGMIASAVNALGRGPLLTAALVTDVGRYPIRRLVLELKISGEIAGPVLAEGQWSEQDECGREHNVEVTYTPAIAGAVT